MIEAALFSNTRICPVSEIINDFVTNYLKSVTHRYIISNTIIQSILLFFEMFIMKRGDLDG